jgi:FtsP/CotA-like multicopper oxidase with cupredoxin domain
MLDDFLIGERGVVPYGREHATHALMGRFGNLLLVNGEPRYRLAVRRGEVVRFFLTNASNTRTFNVSFEGMRLKVVGSDAGLFEREERVESVVLAPAERYIVEGRFERPGAVAITNRVQGVNRVTGAFFTEVDTLGAVVVSRAPAARDHGPAFTRLRENGRVVAELAPYRARAADPPARSLRLTLRADGLPFGLVQALRLDTAYVSPVEWSGTMPMMDWLSTAREVTWVLRDETTGAENMDIAWTFRRGEVVKVRVVNDRHTLHPMAHPIHVHGQRFLALAVDGVPNENLAWKDTFLLPAASTADILLELSTPGRWMLHCHIAEHLEAGMHMVFDVEP